MKTRKRLLSFMLLFALLISCFSGAFDNFARAAGATVTSEQELAFEPLAADRSVAWERHEDGYTVSLDCEADSVTMRVADVPAPANRAGEKVRLYLRTGVTPKAGASYRVSFALSSDAALPAYDVCFDGGTEGTYGSLTGRGIAAGGTDRVSYTLTPETSDGELVLRLLLGRTESGTLRFSDLSVAEADAAAAGETAVLVDNLNLSAPGSVTMWTNDDCKAKLDTKEGSATLTVVEVPKQKAEVWKIKLLAATGVMPEAGKTYRFHADVRSTASRTCEICYNEGDVEKGYAVLYNQSLKAGTQSIDRLIYVPAEKENAGELVFQLSLGLLLAQDAVTISNIRVEEAVPSYTDVLPKDFAFDLTSEYNSYDPDHLVVTGTNPVATTINWDGRGRVERAGNHAFDPVCAGNAVSMEVKPTSVDLWDAMLHLFTGETLDPTSIYRVTLKVKSTLANPKYNIQFGSGKKVDTWDNNVAFGGLYAQTLAADATDTATYAFTTGTESAELLITLQVGEAPGSVITVSDVRIEKLSEGALIEDTVEYPTGAAFNGSFENRDSCGQLTGDGESAVFTRGDGDNYQNGLFVNAICNVESGKQYRVSYKVQFEEEDDKWFCAQYNHSEDEKTKDVDGRKEHIGSGSYTDEITATGDGQLYLFFEFGSVTEGKTVTVSDITVNDQVPDVVYPVSGDTGSFERRAYKGELRGSANSAVFTRGNGDNYQNGLFVNAICNVESGEQYLVRYTVEFEEVGDKWFCAQYNHSEDEKTESVDGRKEHSGSGSYTDVITATGDGQLYLFFEFGSVTKGNRITVSDITVREVSLLTSVDVSFGSVSTEQYDEFSAELTKNSDSAFLKVTKPAGADPGTWKAKLCIKTGVSYEAGKGYRVSFDIEAEKSQQEFCVITKGVPDSQDVRGTWALSLTAGQKTTVTTRPIPADRGSGALDIDIELGKLDAGVDTNTYTVSNVRVEEVTGRMAPKESRIEGAVTNDMQDGYSAPLTRARDSATVGIVKTPDTGREAWKSKLFIDTGVSLNEGDVCFVSMDVLSEQDMDFEVCYNRDSAEKGFDAVYGLHTAAGKTRTIERLFTAERGGKLKIQLSLGNVPAPNAVTVSNLSVKKVSYGNGRSALPAPLTFRDPSAVTYWAHEDYLTRLSGTYDAITMHILQAPQVNAEPWKIKLFLDTEQALEAGKYYRVSAELLARRTQTVEICYNNGGVEMGYDAMGGIQLTGGESKTVEKIIGVPADKTDLNNLMLQVNLGKTSAANEVTVSKVLVEEVSISYADKLSDSFRYQPGDTVSSWTNPDYSASLGEETDKAVLHITQVPAAGAEVWKAKLLVKTGVVLAPGKSYLVHADLTAANAQNYEVCYNNEETEKGYDVLYSQSAPAGTPVAVDKKISVPADMTDAGELILQFSVGGPVVNDITVDNVSVQEMDFGGVSGRVALGAAINASGGTAEVSRGKLTYQAPQNAGGAIEILGASLRSGDRYAVSFKAKADKPVTGTLLLRRDSESALAQPFSLSAEENTYTFTMDEPLDAGGRYDLVWQFASTADGAQAELSDIRVYVPSEELWVVRSTQKVTVNGEAVKPEAYNINGSNYLKLRDLAVLLNGTNAQFVVRYNGVSNTVSVTTGKEYTPVGGELEIGADQAATCVRSPQGVAINGKDVDLKVYNIGGNNFFRIRDLSDALRFRADYDEAGDTVLLTSPPTPEKLEASHDYLYFFRPEIDGETQPFVGDTMPFYENGTYYIYYLKEGGDSYNHSVYLTTTTDFVHYTEFDDPVLSASRADVQDSWIGTGSVVKADDTYYFFYTGFNASGSQEYHEKIMVAKSDTPTSFEKVSGWEITPPASLGQKNDFRDPMAYYDPDTQTFSLTVTASQDGVARVLKYTLNKDLSNAAYDGIIFTDPTGDYWNLECSDTFRIGNKWYLTYSGQEDTLWYAMADSRFGPYSAPARMDGKVFYAAKHVEDGDNTYMVGWARRSETASSTHEVSGWGGNLLVQKVSQLADGSLALVPVDSMVSDLEKTGQTVTADDVNLTAEDAFRCQQVFTSGEYQVIRGEFTYSGTGAFGLAFDYNGEEEGYKLISVDPAEQKLSLSFNEGAAPITEAGVSLVPNRAYAFTYIQDGSVGVFYLDGQAALAVRLYGVTDKPVCLFAENNSVRFTGLSQSAK